MAFFARLYNKVLHWSAHRHAPYYLAGVSFMESSIFPIPPDVMLIPMLLKHPHKAQIYFFITTLASILGGVLGYLLGYFAFEALGTFIVKTFGYEAAYQQVVDWFAHQGFLIVLLAGFTPVPYKLFTIAAGASQMALGPFVLASIGGRAIRFYLVTYLVGKFGQYLQPFLHKYSEILGWICAVSLSFLLFWILKN